MGVPADLDELAATGVVSAEGVARARDEARLAPEAADTSVTEYIGARLGVEIVDRLVDPLLGGVYAGRSRGPVLPGDARPAGRRHAQATPTLTGAAAALLPPRPPRPPR